MDRRSDEQKVRWTAGQMDRRSDGQKVIQVGHTSIQAVRQTDVNRRTER